MKSVKFGNEVFEQKLAKHQQNKGFWSAKSEGGKLQVWRSKTSSLNV